MITLIFSLLLHASATEFKNYGHIYVSGTPTEQELADFKKQKGAVVLDLRAINELGNCSEPAAATKLGLQYNRVMFEPKAKIDPEVIAGIDKAVKEAGDRPILLFCKTGSRAAAWLAIHLAREERMPLEQAMATAKKMGMSGGMEKAAREFLKK